MTGLVLEGGGAKGSYQIGVYYALKDCGIQIDGYCGNSIGAFNSAMLASGKEKELLDFWKNVDLTQVFGLDEECIEKIKQKKFDFPFFSKAFKETLKILKNRGLNTDGMEKIIKTYLDESLLTSPKDFGLCTIRLNKLKPLYLFKEDMTKENFQDYILASCYLPIFRLKKAKDGNLYVDGCFYDNSPVNMLIDKGYDKIYVIRIKTGIYINITKKPKKKVDITYLSPSRSTGAILELDKEKIVDNISMGYYDALRLLKGYDGFKYTFRKKSERYFAFISRKVKPFLMRRVQNFFHATTKKEAVIKAIEYVMEKEKKDYYQIYNIRKVMKMLKKEAKKEHFIYDFVGDLTFL